jgi:hypothetical protein
MLIAISPRAGGCPPRVPGGFPPNPNDHLKSPARGIDRRADELDGSGRSRLREVDGEHIDSRAPVNIQELLFGDIDAGEERLEGRDLEEGDVLDIDDLLTDSSLLLRHDPREGCPDDGIVADRFCLLPGRHGHGVLRPLRVQIRSASDAAARQRLRAIELRLGQSHLFLGLLDVLVELFELECAQRLASSDRRPPLHVNGLNDPRDAGGDRDLLVHHQVRGVDGACGRRLGSGRQAEEQSREK